MASGACICHSNWFPVSLATMHMTSSRTQSGNVLSNRSASPAFPIRSMRTGVSSKGINGPKIAFRGPWMSASAAARWASFMALGSGIGKRSDLESPNPCGVDVAVLSMAMLLKLISLTGLLPQMQGTDHQDRGGQPHRVTHPNPSVGGEPFKGSGCHRTHQLPKRKPCGHLGQDGGGILLGTGSRFLHTNHAYDHEGAPDQQRCDHNAGDG